MVVTAHQPAYLPWLGYFDKIIRSDTYVFMDAVQYERRSFINRNQIKGSNGALWLTVPVRSKGNYHALISDIEVDYSQGWIRKHLDSIYHSYRKAPRFELNYARLERLYSDRHEKLSDLCWHHLLFWLGELGINKNLVKLSDLGIVSRKSDLVLDICRSLGASSYISGKLGMDYLDAKKFVEHRIEVEFQDYIHPIYPQVNGEFLPNLSVVDYWMHSNHYEAIVCSR